VKTARIVLLALMGLTAASPAMAQPAKGAKPAAAATGKQVFDKWCAACHAASDRSPGTASLAVKYGKEMPAALEERTDLTPETVSLFVRQGVLIMPPFRKTEITDTELQALGEYLTKSAK
jgi:(+)-pinoresinol hydroxylase